MPICLSVCLSVCLSAYLSLHPSFFLSTCLPPACIYAYLPTYIQTCIQRVLSWEGPQRAVTKNTTPPPYGLQSIFFDSRAILKMDIRFHIGIKFWALHKSEHPCPFGLSVTMARVHIKRRRPDSNLGATDIPPTTRDYRPGANCSHENGSTVALSSYQYCGPTFLI